MVYCKPGRYIKKCVHVCGLSSGRDGCWRIYKRSTVVLCEKTQKASQQQMEKDEEEICFLARRSQECIECVEKSLTVEESSKLSV